MQFIRYLQSGQSVPEGFSEWSRYCRDFQCPRDYPAASLVGIVSRFINLHASIRGENLSNSDIIIREALLCEAELDHWEKRLPAHWEYSTVSSRDTKSSMFNGPGQSYIYRDLWIGRILDHYRWTRVLVNELLLRHIERLASPSPGYDAQRRKSLAIIYKMASDICISVSSHSCCHSIQPSKIGFVPAASGIFLLLFTLAVAGSAVGVPEELYNWVIKLLENIGRMAGIQQALILARMIKIQRERWALDIDSSPSDIRYGITTEGTVWCGELFRLEQPLDSTP